MLFPSLTHNQLFPAIYPNPVSLVLLPVLSNILSCKYKLYRLIPVVHDSSIFLFGFKLSSSFVVPSHSNPYFYSITSLSLSYLKELIFCK